MSMTKRSLANVADKQQIVERLQKIQPESGRRWGVMTANEMVCHLADSFRMVMGEKQVAPLTEQLLAVPVPMSFVKWFALQVPLPWPKGTKTLPEVDPRRRGNKPTEFSTDLAELRRLLERFTRDPRDFAWQAHPIFGVMRDDEWYRWGYLHMDHHLRQFGA
jgi:hypothetical protein